MKLHFQIFFSLHVIKDVYGCWIILSQSRKKSIEPVPKSTKNLDPDSYA